MTYGRVDDLAVKLDRSGRRKRYLAHYGQTGGNPNVPLTNDWVNTLSALGICPAQFHEDSSELRVVSSYRLVRAQMPLPAAED